MAFGCKLLCSLILTAFYTVAQVHGFQFTNNPPTECGTLTVSWSGGTPPFRLLLIPPRGTLRNLSIPDSAYQGTSGSFSTQLLFAQNQPIMFAMSDATGVTAGGITDLLTVGAAEAGSTCNTADPGADFFFSLDSTLQQCADYPFTNYDKAVQPVTVFGFVPKGQSFSVQAPQGTSYSWKANFPAGTPIAFFMTDAQGRNGGTSEIKVIGSSSDASCVIPTTTSSSSSSRKASSSSSRRTSTQTPTNGDQKTDKEPTSGSKLGLIIGCAAGGFVLLGILAFVAVFCFKRKRNAKAPGVQEPKLDLNYDPSSGLSAPPSNTYLLPSAYNSSNSNLAPSQVAAPYAQDSFASNTSSTQLLGKNPAPHSDFSPYGSQPQEPSTPQAHAAAQPYGAYSSQTSTSGAGSPPPGSQSNNAYSSQTSTSAASGMQSYGYSSQAPTAYGGPQPYGYAPQAAPAAGPYAAYGQYNQYQQYPQGGHQESSYGQAPARGQMYATNADASSVGPYGYNQQPQYPPQPKAYTAGGSSGKAGPSGKGGPPPAAAPQRVVVHTDIEETMDLPEELPPQYSESRAPIPGFPNSYDAAGPPLHDRKG